VRRGLVMISKVLQNLANGIEFGCKEAHMAILNPFITENLSVVHMFFDKLTVRFLLLLLLHGKLVQVAREQL
jgi:hypothetical protein